MLNAMLRFVLHRALLYALIGGVAASVASGLRYGLGRRTISDALLFALIWGVGGAFLALYRGPKA